MKKLYTFFIFFLLLGVYTKAQYVTIPDEGFRKFLKERYPASFNGADMMDTTSNEIVNEDLLDFRYNGVLVKNLNGLKYFKNLVYLNAEMSGTLEDLSVLPNTLNYLNCSGNYNLSSLPTLPSSLTYLNCSGNYNLSSLPTIPNTLKYLNISNTRVINLPALGNSLEYLNCSNIYNLTPLPTIPNTLKYLNCSFSYSYALTGLPNLSSTSLTYLDCSQSGYNFTSLPLLPNSLDTLNCNGCGLTSLPNLPASLTYLDCSIQSNGKQEAITSLPSLPLGLKYLYCGHNNISVLPSLPDGLISLQCGDNLLSTLPPIPNSLLFFDFYANQIHSFPILPNTLKDLNCSGNPLYSIPLFPDSLQTLYCYSDSLTSLPILPSNLNILYCVYNQLSSLPILPHSLKRLDCQDNSILNLPKLPGALEYLNCAKNKLSGLPDLPNSLTEINIEKNNIYCLPKLPDSAYFQVLRITADINEISCIPNKPLGLFITLGEPTGSSNTYQLPLCSPVNNINHCESFPVIQGNVFADINSNGTKDVNEFYMPNINVHIFNRTHAYTNKDGNFEIGTTDKGDYTLTTISPYSYFTAAPPTIDYHFTSTDTLVTTSIALQPNASVDSFKINLHEINWTARPGFAFPCLVIYQNIGTTTVAPNISFNYDNSLFTYDSSSNHSVINSGAILSLQESSMLPGEQRSFYIYLRLKTTAPLSTWFTNLISIAANNSLAQDSTLGQIRGSFDPNDKQATPILSTQEVNQGKFINYTIRFQNTGTDTAFTVVVTDTLSTLLQENTFELINASHPCNATRNGKNLTFEFLNILLPDSNVNEPGSHGYINFRLKPKSPLALNTIISNKAFIYFDYNLPVITNTAQTYIQNNTTVPIKLVRFYANVLTDGYTLLNWISANEINADQYTLQQSTDGINYKNISTVAAKGFGNNQYSIKTLSVNAEVVYYRLKITDIYGAYTYSSILTVKEQTANNGLIILSNVSGNNLMINVGGASLVNTTARILNAEGIVVKNIVLKQGIQNINVANLSAGNYYLQTNTGIKKMIIKN